MARGWESKSVADQIEEGNSARASNRDADSRSPEDLERKRRIESLRLSKSRLLQQLETAKLPAHRKVLLNGLQAIEAEIEELSNAVASTNRLK